MIDQKTLKPIKVYTEGTVRPYLMVTSDQLETVESILRDNQILFWTDTYGISINGGPEVVFIRLERASDATAAQRLLDAAQ